MSGCCSWGPMKGSRLFTTSKGVATDTVLGCVVMAVLMPTSFPSCKRAPPEFPGLIKLSWYRTTLLFMTSLAVMWPLVMVW